jgi:hypothetical protein
MLSIDSLTQSGDKQHMSQIQSIMITTTQTTTTPQGGLPGGCAR